MTRRAKPSVGGLTLSRGVVLKRDLVAILSEAKDVTEEGSEHTKFLIYKNGEWGHHITAWASVAISGVLEPTLEVLVAGVDGEILRAVRGEYTEELIDDSSHGPECVGHIRDVRHIGKKAFAVGMLRQAYRRERPGVWQRIDAGLRATSGEIAGLNSIDGFSESAIYAVGLGGEIWRFDGRIWVQIDSPTNIQLNRVRCVTPDKVFICGSGGIILRGRQDVFEVIEHDLTEDNLYGLEWFQDALYVASLKNVYRLSGNNLSLLDLRLGLGVTCGDLDSKDGVLWSFGANHLACTTNAVVWDQVFVR